MGLFRLGGFLTVDECAALRRGMDDGAVEHAEILDQGIHREADVRMATIIEPASDLVREVESKLDACRTRLEAALGMTLAEREGAGFIRYPEGGFYRPHRDRGEDPQWADAARRAIAMVVFLNSSREASPDGGFEGGVLRLLLPDGDVDVTPEAGTLVAFPADVLHEVTEVRGGTRDSVVDWFYDSVPISA